MILGKVYTVTMVELMKMLYMNYDPIGATIPK